MEVLKHGKLYQERECQNCGCQIGFSYRDIEHTAVKDDYRGHLHETTTEFVYCPECGCRLVLKLRIDGEERK